MTTTRKLNKTSGLHPACIYALRLTHRAGRCGRAVCKLDNTDCVKLGMTKHLGFSCQHCGVKNLGKRARVAFYMEMDPENVHGESAFFFRKELDCELTANIYERWLKKRAWEVYGFPVQHLEYFPICSSSSSSSGAASTSSAARLYYPSSSSSSSSSASRREDLSLIGKNSVGLKNSSRSSRRGPASVSEFQAYLLREIEALETNARAIPEGDLDLRFRAFYDHGMFLLQHGRPIFQDHADLDLSTCSSRGCTQRLDRSGVLVPALRFGRKYRRRGLLEDDDSSSGTEAVRDGEPLCDDANAGNDHDPTELQREKGDELVQDHDRAPGQTTRRKMGKAAVRRRTGWAGN
ncbi:unnamed protein product [Amoebophrya sp. A120]|nr:unnamed protein product [Amoebophrya sp. A120]|eukprot:GSA120T00019960001.1